MDIKIDLSRLGINEADIIEKRKEAEKAMDFVWDAGDNKAGWVREPMKRKEYEIEEIIMTSLAAQDSCTLFIVICNGGIRASLEAAIAAFDEIPPAAPEIEFVGEDLSTFALGQVLQKMRHYEVNVCVISESGMTAETIFSYQVIREAMIRRYGEEKAFKRILVMTGNEQGKLYELASKDGSGIFDMQKGFSGYYFILSPAALFVLAVAGIDIKDFRLGAELAATDPAWDLNAVDYALARVLMAEEGRGIEVVEVAEPSLNAFAKWLAGMYGASTATKEKPIISLPLSLVRDFKSLGRSLLANKDGIFQTELVLEEVETDMVLHPDLRSDLLDIPGSTNRVNAVMAKKIKEIYQEQDIKSARLTVDQMNSHRLGQAMYFFMMSAAISTVMAGADPFDSRDLEKIKEESLAELCKLGG